MVEFIARMLETPADEIVVFSLQHVVARDDSVMHEHVDVHERGAVVNVGFSIEGLPMKTIIEGHESKAPTVAFDAGAPHQGNRSLGRVLY